jgi:hypothetical protein
MSAEVFALPAAVGWAAEAIFIREGSQCAPVSLQDSNAPIKSPIPLFTKCWSRYDLIRQI